MTYMNPQMARPIAVPGALTPPGALAQPPRIGAPPAPAIRPPTVNAAMGPQPQMPQVNAPSGAWGGRAPTAVPNPPMPRPPAQAGNSFVAPGQHTLPSGQVFNASSGPVGSSDSYQKPMGQPMQQPAPAGAMQPQAQMRQQPIAAAGSMNPYSMNPMQQLQQQQAANPRLLQQPQSQQMAQPMQQGQQYPGQPTISTGGVYTQEQQDQLINQALGSNAMQAGTQGQQVNNQLSGAGFSAGGSPKSMALLNQIQAARMGADNQARTGIPLQLAQMNAQQNLASQRAAEEQYGNRQNERLTGQGQNLGFLSNLFGSLLT